MAKSDDFRLGEQPQWAGRETCKTVGLSFLQHLLNEPDSHSLVKRCYAVILLPDETTIAYSTFHKQFEAFCDMSEREKAKYATQQFDVQKHSPNQLHGYSKVANLKEQFMMRVCGEGSDLITPDTQCKELPGDFGTTGMRLYEDLDQICRNLAYDVADHLQFHRSCVTKILDPIHRTNGEISRNFESGFGYDVCHSEFVPPKYISSSIMDNFRYIKSSKDKTDRFHNNHAAHTDSGLLTLVVTTDVPGLEIFDSEEKGWIPIEVLLHKHCEDLEKDYGKLAHRRFASVFWSDSVSYLPTDKLIPCLHRVGDCDDTRHSVVFKQRTTPVTTACRYQEDYILLDVQKASLKTEELKRKKHRPMVFGAFLVFAALVARKYFLQR